MYRQERAGPGQCLHVIMQKDTMMATTIKRRIFIFLLKLFGKKNHYFVSGKTAWATYSRDLCTPFHLFKYQPRGGFHCHSSDTAGLTCISSNESCFLPSKYRHSRWLLISSSHAKSSLLSSLSFLTCL